jgi:FAD dependent oxidoreductase TIGR03364
VKPVGRVVVVGAGVLGVMHALFAREAGFEVRHLERELAPRGASVRNFGLVWVGGRAAGAELELALRARTLWEQVAGRVGALVFRPAGSLTLATEEAELALAKKACEKPDAAAREWELLDGPGARRVNPEVSNDVVGALWCRADAVVEPRSALHAVRSHLLGDPLYRWLPGREVVELGASSVRDDRGEDHSGDRVFLCIGANISGLVRRNIACAPTRRVRLQMLQTGPYPGQLTTALADGGSMRYYPSFDLPGRACLPAQPSLGARWRAQLLVVQRTDGSLTIGDTHSYEEPFAFDVEQEIYEHLLAKARSLLRQRVPEVRRHWAGVYSEMAEPSEGLYWREEIFDGVEVVTGAGGRGMTCAPAIAEESVARLASG